MRRNILLLFDNIDIREEVVDYAIVLAGRMNAGIIILLLLRLNFESDGNGGSDEKRVMSLMEEGEMALEPWMKKLDGAQVSGAGIVRIGEPASEFIKFLSEEHDFNMVVWGGDKALLGDRRPRIGEHWMAGIRENLGCPMVAP